MRGEEGENGDEGALVSRASLGTATRGRWRWVRERGGRPRNALLVEGLEDRDYVVLILFCWIIDNAQAGDVGTATVRGVLYFCCALKHPNSWMLLL